MEVLKWMRQHYNKFFQSKELVPQCAVYTHTHTHTHTHTLMVIVDIDLCFLCMCLLAHSQW